MEISPILLLWLLVASLAFGVGMGVLTDLHRLVRVGLGARYSQKTLKWLYEKPLPVVGHPLRRRARGKLSRIALPILTFVQDLLWFVIAAVGIAILNYWFNQGRFRLFTVLAMLVGFAVYELMIGKLVMRVSESIMDCVRAIGCVLFALISRPIVRFVDFFVNFAKKIVKKVQNTLAKKRIRVYNKNKKKDVLRQAEQGFLHKNV